MTRSIKKGPFVDPKLMKKVLKAKESGVDAIKIQSYEADTITLNYKNNHFYKKIFPNNLLKIF